MKMPNWIKRSLGLGPKKTVATVRNDAVPEIQAIDEQENASVAQKNIADTYLDQGDWENAAIYYRRAIAIDSEYAAAHNNLGLALCEQRQYETATTHLMLAVSINPKLVNSYYTLGDMANKLGKFDEALHFFRKAVAIKPDFAEAWDYLGFLLRDRGELKAAIDCYRKALSINPQLRETHSGLLFAMQIDDTLAQSEIYAQYRQFSERFESPLASTLRPHANEKSPGRRIKIGYVSPDFRRHSVGLFMRPLLANHDHDQFEVYCYYNYETRDDFTERFSSLADQFIFCASMSDDELAEKIRADGIDILVDLAGHSAYNRLLTFARKPAPIQITYLGYPGTSGLSAMDYRVTDTYAEPINSEQFYSEKLISLPDSMWCYQPYEEMPEVTPLPALANGYVTFGSLNAVNKISSECITLWSALLRSIPTSRLLIVTAPEGEVRQRLSRQFLECGVASERLSFCDKLSTGEFQRTLQLVDISLDPFPTNGATTTCESLWLGVPTLGLIGNRFLSRAGFSILNAAQLSDFAAATDEDYIKTAIHLANNLPLLAEIRAGMRDKLMTTPLTDVRGFTHNLESLFRDAWKEWCERSQ